jgi:hypothetical protein
MRRVSALSLFVGHHLFKSARLLFLADRQSAQPPVPYGSVVTKPISQIRMTVLVASPVGIGISTVLVTTAWMDRSRYAAPSIGQLQDKYGVSIGCL